jgi:ABC-type amino acid transport substrate-binding protein
MRPSFTATITSVLTVSQLESPVNGPEDLPDVRVGTVKNSTAAKYLEDRQIAYIGFDTPLDGLQAVKDGRIEAMVYDAPILKYLVNTRIKGNLRVLPGTFESQDYGIGLPQGNKFREPINRAMLKILHSDSWQETLRKYMGE